MTISISSYNSYLQIKEARQIKENYELISSIKSLIAKQYNKEANDVTKDEIIAFLPKDSSWEKVLKISREQNAQNFIDENGDLLLSEDEKIKLLALKSKLKAIVDTSTLQKQDGVYKIDLVINQKSFQNDEEILNKHINKAKKYLVDEILYNNKLVDNAFIDLVVSTFTPSGYESENFRNSLRNSLKNSKSGDESMVYFKTKDYL